MRIVSNPAFSRDAVRPGEAMQVLRANTSAKDHHFWPDELPFGEAVAFAGLRLLGHQQVTDAYLLGLALRRGGRLALWTPESRRSPNPNRRPPRRWRSWSDEESAPVTRCQIGSWKPKRAFEPQR